MNLYPSNLNDLLCRIYSGGSSRSLTDCYSSHNALLYRDNLLSPRNVPVIHLFGRLKPSGCSVYCPDVAIDEHGVVIYRPGGWLDGEFVVMPGLSRPMEQIFHQWLMEPMPEIVLLRCDKAMVIPGGYEIIPVNVFGSFVVSVKDEEGVFWNYPCISSWRVCAEGMPRYRFLMEMNRVLNSMIGLNPLSDMFIPDYPRGAVLFRSGGNTSFCPLDDTRSLSDLPGRYARIRYLHADYLAILASVMGYTGLERNELLMLLHGPIGYAMYRYLSDISVSVARKSSIIMSAYLLGRMASYSTSVATALLSGWKTFRARVVEGLVMDGLHVPDIESRTYSERASICDTDTIYKTYRLMCSQLGVQPEFAEVARNVA